MNRRAGFPKMSLRSVFIIPFVALIVLAVGVVGYLSFWNGRRAVGDVVRRLRGEVTARISQHLHTFLEMPHLINEQNAYALQQGWLPVEDQTFLARYFWQQVHTFDSVTSIYFGNAQGGLTGGGREGTADVYYTTGTRDFVAGTFEKHLTDVEGRPATLASTFPGFDARTRPWYTRAQAAHGPAWGAIYVLFTEHDIAIPASRPVYSPSDELLGVVSIDIFLTHLSDFLETIEIGRTGGSFIIERSGLLVASSTGELPFSKPDSNGQVVRLLAHEHPTALVRDAAGFLLAQFGDYAHITVGHQIEFTLNGQRHFLEVTPFRDLHGIDWLIVVVIPEADFMAQINANNRSTLALIALALSVSVILGFLTADWVAQPVLRLNASARALARGAWTPVDAPGSWIDEIHQLTVSFNEMAQQLQETLESLTAEISERKRLLAQIQEQARKTRQIMDTVPVGVFLVEDQGRVLLANPLAERYLAALAPGWMEATTHLGETPLVEVLASAPDALAREVSVANAVFEATARPIVESAAPGEWVVVINDVTQQRIAERQQQQQARLAAVGQLATGIAHDFNNIMTAILLYAQITSRTPGLADKVRERIDIIAQQARHASNLIQQILDFSRRSVLERRTLDLLPLLKEEVKLLQRTLPDNIQVQFEYQSQFYPINADPTRIQQMVMNLALNARDAMPDGGRLRFGLALLDVGPEGLPHLPPLPSGQWVRLSVADTGGGIPPEVLPHIFEPFFTTRAPLGSGLGLAQVHGIVAQHEGHIDVTTEIGQGTTFTVYLPAVTPTEVHQLPLPAEGLAALPQGAGQTILVVEDEDAVLLTLREGLESLGYRVEAARHGKAALELLTPRSANIALVLSDVMMPQMGGVALFQELRRRGYSLPVVLISGHMMEEQLQELREQGLQGWLMKPPSLEQLAQTLARILVAETEPGAGLEAESLA